MAASPIFERHFSPAELGLPPALKAFIDGAVVPALIKEWLAQNDQQNPLASESPSVDNPQRLAANAPAAQEPR